MNTRILPIGERLVLYRRGRFDARHSNFRLYPSGKPITEECYNNVISAFIQTEIKALVAKCEFIFTKNSCYTKIKKGKDAKRQGGVMSFADALAEIDYQLEELKQKQNAFVKQESLVLEEAENRREGFEISKVEHYVSLYRRQVYQLNEKICRNTIDSCTSMIVLLNEKVRLYELINARFSLVCVRYFMRIQYYYEKACIVDKRLPVSSMSDDFLMKLIPEGRMSKIRKELEEMCVEREKILATINVLEQKSNMSK